MSSNFLRLYFALFFMAILSCLSADLFGQPVIIDNPKQYQIDRTARLIVCNQVPKLLTTKAGSIKFDRLYTFTDSVSSFRTDQMYTVIYNDTTYQLSFTQFPIIAIDTKGIPIVQNVLRTSKFVLTDSIGITTTSYAGINIRGAFSSTYPKKSYKIEFWADTVNQTAKDVALLNMRTDSDWILLAMYNESSRINNVTSHALWRTMHRLYYTSQEPTALSGIHTRYVDVFVNGSYAGVYALGENMDRKQLQLKKTKDNGSARGELYKTYSATNITLFRAMDAKNGDDTTWNGFELKYPKQPGFWTNLYGLVDSTVNWSDVRFTSQIANKWQIDNLVDYFLFLNLVHATDNTGKNLFVARYKEGEPYFFVAWDLDGTWGYLYEGSRDNTTTDILTNGLYNRLLKLNPANFKQKLKVRWFNLRTNLFATATLKNNLASNATLLTNSGAYLRESLRWPVSEVNAELAYANTWIDNRTAFLDSYFSGFPDVCANAVAPTLSVSSSTITIGRNATLTASGCPYTVSWNTGQVGQNLTVSPWSTTSYWAVCNQTGAACMSPASATATLTVLPDTNWNTTKADLRLSLSSSKRVVPINSTTRMNLLLTNDGPDMARTIRLQNRLPAGFLFAGNVDPSITHLDGIVNVSLDSLDAYQTIMFSFDVKPVSDEVFLNTAQILNSATYDPDSTPGSGTADGEDDMAMVDIRTPDSSTLVAESPNPSQRLLPSVLSDQPMPASTDVDLSLRMELDKRVVSKGGSNTIKMIISNAGGLDATGVAVQCVLPAGVQYVEGSGSSVSGSVVSATGLAIAAGNTATVTFQVQANSSGSWKYEGQIIASDQSDTDSTPGNGTTNGEDDAAWVDFRVK